MSSHLSNYPYGGYGGPHQYAYNLQDETVQRVPSGVHFQLSQIDAGMEELEKFEKGIDPLNIFPTFLNLDCAYASNTSDTTSTSNTSNDTRCLPLLDVNIDVNVQSSIAKTKVTQTFTNMSNQVIKEANYSFPLYDGSAVISFRCHVGDDKLLEGVIKPRGVAREDFKQAVAKQKVAALLEEHTPEIFETKLGNIPARTSVKVEITYVNELKADIEGEGVLVTLPTSIAPRYGALPLHMSASSATDNNGLHITVHVHTSESLRKLESRTHPISVEMGTAGTAGTPAAVSSFGDLASADEGLDNGFDPKKAKATLSERHVTLGRDFVLLILASGSKMLASGALLDEALGAGAQSAMRLTLNPRDLFSSCVEPESFNGEIIFIADRSGSMHGLKMDTLKGALNVFLKSLTEKVHFNIYSFGSTFTSLWPQSQLYTDSNVELAVRNISTFSASMGGTEIIHPIKEAVRKRIIKKNFTTQIICLTDGEVWEEAMVRNFVRETRSELKDAIRFFALGIGNEVSHRLIEGIGTEGGGFAEVVAVDNRGRWEGRVMRLVKGALTPKSYNCEIEFNGMSTKETCFFTMGSSFMQAPYEVPALHPFSRTTIYFLFDKSYGTHLNVVTLKTSTPSGEQISVEVPVSKATANTYAVHHLAAKAIVIDLETSKSWLHGNMSNGKAVDTAAKELGERLAISYHITSKWTSFVAVEKKRKEENVGRLYKAPKRDLVMLNKNRMAPFAPIQQASGLALRLAPRQPLFESSLSKLPDQQLRSISLHQSSTESDEYLFTSPMRCINDMPVSFHQSATPKTRSSEMHPHSPSLVGADNIFFKMNASSFMQPSIAVTSSTSKYKKPRWKWWARFRNKKTDMRDESPQHVAAAGVEAPEGIIGPQELDTTFDSTPRRNNAFTNMGAQSYSSQNTIFTDATYDQKKNPSTDEAQSREFLPFDAPLDCHEGSMALNLHNLIRLQSIKGSFKLPPYFIRTLCSHFKVDILSTLEDILSSNGENMKAKLDEKIELLLQTLLAVMWIKLACAEDKEIWELLVSKAERWVGEAVGNKEMEEKLCECARTQWILPSPQGP